MKKKIIAILLLITVIAGCTPQNKPPETPENSPAAPTSAPDVLENGGSVSDWFPFLENTVYVYEGNGIVSSSSYESYYGYVERSRAQRRVSAGSLAATEILDASGGELKLTYGDSTAYFYDNIMDNMGVNMHWVLLKEPFIVGNKWALNDHAVNEITDMSKIIETPAGEFETMEVTTTNENGNVEIYNYAKGIGLVRSSYESSKGEIVSELKELKEETGIQTPVTFFRPNVTKNEVEKFASSIVLMTNNDLPKLFETEMKKTPTEDFVPLLTANTTIQSLTFDWKEQIATVDLSSDYLEEINVGDGIQSTILQCIANTIGNFYGIYKVKITVNGSPFKSGSISYGPDEYLTVEREL